MPVDVSAAGFPVAPGLGVGFSMLTKTYDLIKNVKVYRKRCENVHRQCTQLLVALQDSGEGLEGSPPSMIIAEVEALIRQVKSKATEWSQYSYMKSFLLQSDIQEGLQELDKRIQTIGLEFSIKIGLDTARFNQDMRIAQKNDQMEIRDLLARLVNDVEEVRKLVNLESPTRPVVEEVMQSLQTELRAPDLQPDHEKTFKKGLWMLHQRTHKLPPMTDLTGQVEVISKYRVAAGTHNDVYIGMWLGREKVALRLPRLLPGSRGVQKRFEKDLTIWRKIDHPNVVPLYGIFYQGSDIYSVSPWMDHGTVLDYIGSAPDADRLKIIYQAATGLEYLHQNGIIHGDLRAGNILINRDGIACLSDFGMSKMLEDVGHSNTTSPGYNPRWCAPELLKENAIASKQTDVWSFSMACLEVLTGEPPFAHVNNDVGVYPLLQNGKLPRRPPCPRVSDPVWSLFRKCWEKKPTSRPTISVIKQRIAEIRNVPAAKRSSHTVSSSAQETQRRASVLGFRWANGRGSFSSSGSSTRVVPPQAAFAFVEEPESIAHSASYSSGQSFREAPRLEVFLGKNEEWRFEIESGTSGSGSSSEQFATPSSSPSPVILPTPLSECLPLSVTTSGSSSRFSTSTRAAVTDCNIVIRLLRDGTVASGTLEGLVERLINGFGLRRDVEFRDILLSSTVDFVSAEEFFSVIERRFNEAERAVVPHPEDRVGIQYKILSVLSYWVLMPHLPLEPQLVWQMRNFCENAKSRLNSGMMREKADSVIQALNKDIRAASLPPPIEGPPLQAFQMRPSDLAIGLTLLESDKFKQIHPSDYLLYLEERPGPNAVEAAKEVSLKIVKWAQKFMLHHDDVLKRAEVMTFFLNTARECLLLHNFSSAVAIATAFDSSLIDDLCYTKDQLESPLKHIFRNLRDLISEDRQNYRKAFANASSESHECVPWLTVHLTDLRAILDQYQATCEYDGHTVINFERYMHFRAYLQEDIPPHRTAYASLEQFRNEGQLAYVQSKLNTIVLGDNSVDAALEARANEIKKAEQREKRYRTVERNKLGFS